MTIKLSQHLCDTVSKQTEYDELYKCKIYCRALVYLTRNTMWLKEFVFILISQAENRFIL